MEKVWLNFVVLLLIWQHWLAGSKDMKDMGRKIAEKAIERQFEIMEEQQQKGQEFVNAKVRDS